MTDLIDITAVYENMMCLVPDDDRALGHGASAERAMLDCICEALSEKGLWATLVYKDGETRGIPANDLRHAIPHWLTRGVFSSLDFHLDGYRRAGFETAKIRVPEPCAERAVNLFRGRLGRKRGRPLSNPREAIRTEHQRLYGDSPPYPSWKERVNAINNALGLNMSVTTLRRKLEREQ